MTQADRVVDFLWSVAPDGATNSQIAPFQFLVFGNDRAVPTLWLERHGRHATSVQFYFLPDDGKLERLHP